MSTLHARLVARIDRGDPYGVIQAWRGVRAAVELHEPILFGGVVGCLACSPGMPAPILIDAPCPTITAIAKALGVDGD